MKRKISMIIDSCINCPFRRYNMYYAKQECCKTNNIIEYNVETKNGFPDFCSLEIIENDTCNQCENLMITNINNEFVYVCRFNNNNKIKDTRTIPEWCQKNKGE